MRSQILCVASLCGVILCAGGGANPSSDTRPMEVVRSKFAAFNRHDAAVIENTYAQNAVLNSPDYSNLTGNRAIADTYRKIFESIPDARDDIQLLEAAGDHVYVQFVLSGHWNGAPDKPLQVRIMSAYEIKEGRIVDDATYYDRKVPAPHVALFIDRRAKWMVE